MSKQWDQTDIHTYHSRIHHRVPGYDTLHNLSATLMSRYLLKAEGTILVIGAGGGEEIIRMANLLPNARFIALDSSKKMLTLARERCEKGKIPDRVQFIWGTASDLPKGITYDAAVCLLMFHFIEQTGQKQAFITMINHHLSPGAPFLIASVCGERKSHPFQQHLLTWSTYVSHRSVPLDSINSYVESMGKTNHPISSKTLKHQLKHAGFREITTYFQALFVEAIFCRKGDPDEK